MGKEPTKQPNFGFNAVEEAIDAVRLAKLQEEEGKDNNLASRAVRSHKSPIHEET